MQQHPKGTATDMQQPPKGTAADAAADSSPPLTAVKVNPIAATDTMADTVRGPRGLAFLATT